MGSGTRHCQTKKIYFGIDHQDDSDSIILVVLYHNLKIQTGRCHDIFYYLQDDVLLSFFSQTESLHVHRIPARNLSFRKSPIEFFQNPNGGSLKTLAQSNHFVTSKHVGGSKKGLIISYRILTMKLRTRELRFLPVVFFGGSRSILTTAWANRSNINLGVSMGVGNPWIFTPYHSPKGARPLKIDDEPIYWFSN